MLATFIALLAAHVVADFVLQFPWIINNKRRFSGFATHIFIVAVTALVALGAFNGESIPALVAVTVVTVAHAVIDALKLWAARLGPIRNHRRGALSLFIADQAAHLLTLVIVAAAFPLAWADGYWSMTMPQHQGQILAGFCLASGFILTTRTGQFVIGMFMQGFTLGTRVEQDSSATESEDAADPGLPEGGAWIGLLERALIFILVLLNQFGAIGFLIAAKSVLRFQYARERSHSEVVIIGTLASFTWAILLSWLTLVAVRLVLSL